MLHMWNEDGVKPYFDKICTEVYSSELNKCSRNTIARHSVSVADPSDEMNFSRKRSSQKKSGVVLRRDERTSISRGDLESFSSFSSPLLSFIF